MQESLRHLLTGAFDYAGLFPPAGLPMDQAVAEFGRLLESERAGLISRFVVPAAWLDDLAEHLPAGLEDEPWGLTVLGTSLEGLRQDMALISHFEERAQGRAVAEVYEVKSSLDKMEPGLLRNLDNAGFDAAFVELAWGDELSAGMHKLADTDSVGVKVRTGGLEASAFPSGAAFAAFLQESLQLDLPFKLTAGLHHPLPFVDQAIGATHHGFINVLVAGCLADVHELSRAEIEKILAETNASAFWFSPDGLGYGDFEVELGEIDDFRGIFAAIGSCSIDEPYESLAQIGWTQLGVTI